MKAEKNFFIFLFMMLVLALPNKMVMAEESTDESTDEVIWIHDYDELVAISQNPYGKYKLANDIDCAGKDWLPVDFCGELDGDGYSILNLTITRTADTVETTYDGNMKTYDTVFAGFFSTLKDASVKNLGLVNIRCDITKNQPVFLGGMAGFMERSRIDNCNITGRLDLSVDAKMFGIGGIVGFGNGSIDNTTADVTLVSIDTNKEERDEQFMGGAYGAGYISLGNCKVIVDGFDSDHGYVHNGGLVGMFGLYPAGIQADTYIKNNRIEGKITFFEDNTDRRAYCAPYYGEVLNWTFDWGGCSEDFISDERKDYSRNLLPDMCDNPTYSAQITESTYAEYGYTTYVCEGCGYAYKDDYVLKTGDLERIQQEKESVEEYQRVQEESIKASEEESRRAEQETLTEAIEEKEQDGKSGRKKYPIAVFAAMVAILATGCVMRKTKK